LITIFTSPFPFAKPTFGGFNGKHKYVRFKLGYSYDQIMVFKIGHITIDDAKPEWSDDSMEKMICINLQKKIY
jgi:hypothetical protein